MSYCKSHDVECLDGGPCMACVAGDPPVGGGMEAQPDGTVHFEPDPGFKPRTCVCGAPKECVGCGVLWIERDYFKTIVRDLNANVGTAAKRERIAILSYLSRHEAMEPEVAAEIMRGAHHTEAAAICGGEAVTTPAVLGGTWYAVRKNGRYWSEDDMDDKGRPFDEATLYKDRGNAEEARFTFGGEVVPVPVAEPKVGAK